MQPQTSQPIPVVIYCGGQGTRMRGGTLTKKELVEIGGRPIIWHVMRIFSTYGFNHFVLPLGYEAQQIKNYFLNYETMSRDFTVKVGRQTNHIQYHGLEEHPEWEVSLVDTGLHTEKASRLTRVAKYLSGERFFLTYGDGVGNVNIYDLLAFHCAHGRLVTITAIRPHRYQYGVMDSDSDGRITHYEQYPALPYWVNGGFMVLERATLDRIGEGDDVALETGILPELVAEGEVMMYRHAGFWHSMDTLQDAIDLEEAWRQSAPWKVWD
jgi:glucose-1-phosphate cytidylyltransferase